MLASLGNTMLVMMTFTEFIIIINEQRDSIAGVKMCQNKIKCPL